VFGCLIAKALIKCCNFQACTLKSSYAKIVFSCITIFLTLYLSGTFLRCLLCFPPRKSIHPARVSSRLVLSSFSDLSTSKYLFWSNKQNFNEWINYIQEYSPEKFWMNLKFQMSYREVHLYTKHILDIRTQQ
jgi:hypothetical protein